MNNYFFNLLRYNRKIFFLLIFLVLIICILLSLSLLRKDKPSSSPLPIIYQASPLPSPPVYILPENYRKLLDNEIKDLHWINNNELAYTFFDSTVKQRALAKINITNRVQTTLIKDVHVKLSEVYWSQKNDLIIFDYGDPYTTYQYDYTANKLTKMGLNGYGYSWSPDGNLLFFYDLKNNPPSPKIYNQKANSFTPINITDFPPFQASYWSQNPDKIILYNINFETGRGEVNLLNLSTNSISKTGLNNLVFPSLSPSGNKLAYASEGGVYLTINNSGQNLIYNTTTNPQFLSFAWLSDDELIVLDGEKSSEQFILLSLQSNTNHPVLQNIKTQREQRARFTLSPDSNTLALALDKDGLWVIKKSFIK